MIMADQEQMCVAHRELAAAHRDWIRVFRTLRSTLRYEDLVPVVKRLDEVVHQFMEASELFTGRKNAASNPARQRPALASSDAAALCNALAASEQRLEAALRLVDELRTQESLFKQQVTLLSEAVAQARQFAYHDELTGLPNRRLLTDRFN
jgi:hypothetical protein